jgi:hypothetical protein
MIAFFGLDQDRVAIDRHNASQSIAACPHLKRLARCASASYARKP